MTSKELYLTTLIADANLKAYYRFSNGAETTDSSPNGYSATKLGNNAPSSSGKFGYCEEFDGSSGGLLISDLNSFEPTNATISMWIYCHNYASSIRGLANFNENDITFSINTSGNLRIGVYNGSTTVYSTSSATIPLNTWTHVVFVKSGTGYTAYINGVADGTQTTTVTWEAGTPLFHIGCGNADNSWVFDGLIDDVAIFDRALTATEISNLYKGYPIDYYNTGDDNFQTSDGANWSAQSFTASKNYSLTSVRLLMYKKGTDQDFIVSIRNASSDDPTGSDLTSKTLNSSILGTGTSGTWVEVEFDTPISLTAGSQYAIVIRCPNGTSDTNDVRNRGDWSSPTYTGGSFRYSTNSGSSWSAGGADFMFETMGTPENINYDATFEGSSGDASSVTYGHGCSGSNRLLVVAVIGAINSDNITGVTYGGDAMTLVDKQIAGTSSRYTYLFYLLNPKIGYNNVVVSASSSSFIWPASSSYTGVKQSAQPDASNKAHATAGSPASVAVTTVADKSWVMAICFADATVTGGISGTTQRINNIFYDSNAPKTPAGSFTIGSQWSSPAGNRDWAVVAASFAPYIAKTTYDVTVTAKARLKIIGNDKTVTAKARVKKLSNDKTVTAKVRVKTEAVEKTITAKARVKQFAVEQTATAKARIKKQGTGTVQAKANIAQTMTKTVTAKANIIGLNAKTIQAKADIRKIGINNTVQAKAKIEKAMTRTATAKARIKKEGITKTIVAKARIKKLATAKTVQAKAAIFFVVNKSITAKARIKMPALSKTITAKTRIKNTLAKTITAKARIWAARLGVTHGIRVPKTQTGRRLVKSG